MAAEEGAVLLGAGVESGGEEEEEAAEVCARGVAECIGIGVCSSELSSGAAEEALSSGVKGAPFNAAEVEVGGGVGAGPARAGDGAASAIGADGGGGGVSSNSKAAVPWGLSEPATTDAAEPLRAEPEEGNTTNA